MKKKLFLPLSFVLVAYAMKGQRIMNSTMSSLGYSAQVKSNYYAHVLTQNSVQGTFVAQNGLIVRQGFKQGLMGKYPLLKNQTLPVTSVPNLTDPIQLNVYPNPFADNITLRFENVSTTPTQVVLYDLSGNIILQKEYPANLQEFTLHNLGHLRIEKYFIKVNQNNQTSTVSLLKN